MFDNEKIEPTSLEGSYGTPEGQTSISKEIGDNINFENQEGNEESSSEQETKTFGGQQQTTEQISPAQRNFRSLIEKNKRIERERDEAIRYARELQSAKSQVNNEIEEVDEEINIGADDIAEGKHVKAITKKIQRMEEKIRKYEQASTAMSAEALLKAQYPDIDKVVTKETIAALRDADPEFAEMLDTSTSFRAKAVSAYKHIKKLGLYTEDTYQADRDLAQRNAAKPKPLISVSPQQGDSPLSRANAFANGLTPELQKQLRQEMEDARKNR